METVHLDLTAEEAEDLRHALSVAKDALIHSDRDAAVLAQIGPEECEALDAKLVEAS